MDVAQANREAIDKIKSRCHAARITVSRLCGEAEVAYSTFWRAAKNPASVSVDTLGKLESKLDEIEAAKAQAAA